MPRLTRKSPSTWAPLTPPKRSATLTTGKEAATMTTRGESRERSLPTRIPVGRRGVVSRMSSVARLRSPTTRSAVSPGVRKNTKATWAKQHAVKRVRPTASRRPDAVNGELASRKSQSITARRPTRAARSANQLLRRQKETNSRSKMGFRSTTPIRPRFPS